MIPQTTSLSPSFIRKTLCRLGGHSTFDAEKKIFFNLQLLYTYPFCFESHLKDNTTYLCIYILLGSLLLGYNSRERSLVQLSVVFVHQDTEIHSFGSSLRIEYSLRDPLVQRFVWVVEVFSRWAQECSFLHHVLLG